MSETTQILVPVSPVDLNKTVKKTYLDMVFSSDDSKAHRFDVPIVRGGSPVALPSGTSVKGYFIRYSDSATVPIDGSADGSTASVTLPKSCYKKTGAFALIIKVVFGDTTSTVFYGEGSVLCSCTDTIVDPDNVIPSLSELLAQIDAMEKATADANTAATNANIKAASANTATKNANTATADANTATTNANKAATKINGLTIAASGLAAGKAPTASLSEVDGHYHIVLGIPKGDTGATPQISVEVSTGAAGSEASVSVTGTAENPVIHLTIPRGDVGDIGSLTINGKSPDGSGAVTLYASDVGALAASNGAGAHNAVYRGKNLGTAVTDAQWAAIAAGTFEDMYIGDYWTIGGITYRIAAFDYYYKTGDTSCETHHVTLVPDSGIGESKGMNDSNVTTGAYVGSKMYTTHLPAVKTTIDAAFGSSHILNHRQYLQNAVTDNYASGGSWYDSTVELMTEQNVYGCKVFGNMLNGTAKPDSYTVDNSQYPLFALDHSKVNIRKTYWLRDVASATLFCRVYYHGYAYCSNASDSSAVRPAFSIC